MPILFENPMLGKLPNFSTDWPRVAYKKDAYKKKQLNVKNKRSLS